MGEIVKHSLGVAVIDATRRQFLPGDPGIRIERGASFAVMPAFAIGEAVLNRLAGAAIPVLRIKSLFRLIPSFKLTERLFKIESEPDVNTAMLSWLVSRLRFYGAITLVALYAVCVVMPSAALAFPRGSAPSHCLTDDHHRIANQDGIHERGSIYVHGSGAIGKHADNSMKGGDRKQECHAGACCGLFCWAAITRDSGAAVVQPVHASLLFGALDERLDSHGPKRIGRPPKPFVSL